MKKLKHRILSIIIRKCNNIIYTETKRVDKLGLENLSELNFLIEERKKYIDQKDEFGIYSIRIYNNCSRQLDSFLNKALEENKDVIVKRAYQLEEEFFNKKKEESIKEINNILNKVNNL